MFKGPKVIAIFGTKGGVGKSVIATNLAVSLASQTGKRVALLDLDLRFGGDLAKMLGLSPKKSVAEISAVLSQPNKSKGVSIEDYMVKHPSGVDLLTAILKPRHAPLITPPVMEKVFELLRSSYEYIVVDAGKSFTDVLISTFDNANLILLVLTPDTLAVYQTQWNLEMIESLHFPLSMVKVILNRFQSKGGVSRKEVEAVMPCNIIASIPSEGKIMGLALNKGIPAVIDSPRSGVSDAVKGLASLLGSEEAEKIFIERQGAVRPRVKEELPEEEQFWEKYGQAEEVIDLTGERQREREDEIIILKRKIHERLLDELDLKKLDVITVAGDPIKARELRKRTEAIISNLLAKEAGGIISSYEVRKTLVKEITDEALGLGPLEDLLKDPEVTDILVNNKDQIYVERHGKLELTAKKFISNDQVRVIMERILTPLGRRIDEAAPMVDARLPDGSRVHAVIPPLSIKGPALSIRKFLKERFSAEDLINFGTITPEIDEFLHACVIVRKNMIISGGAGSGKTTLLNILSRYIPEDERIITIEDAAELKLQQEHWISMEARLPNIEGKGEVTVRDLFRNSLRMRPDRIIVGECRGNETPDMLQAVNTGHDGSLTTIHANTTHDVIARLDSLVLMSGMDLPLRSIREQIAFAINLIIHTARLSDGSRKVTCITEVTNMVDDVHIGLEDIFVFHQTGIDKKGKVIGYFSPTGYIPSFIAELKAHGIELSEKIFQPKK